MILHELGRRNLIHPPRWLPDNTLYLTVMGSQAYGVSTDSSDQDVYGVCIPPKELVFPHLAGEIPGFGRQVQRFEVWQEHHVRNPDKAVEYDFAVYGIVKFFQLCMDNNPNMIDSLFVPRTAIIHTTPIAEMFREERRAFLHKGAWHKFKGYAYARASKIRNKVNSSNEKRAAQIAEFGYDLKFAYHCVRLMNEVEQILVEGDLDLQRNREQLKSIRRGEWTLEQFEAYFQNKEHALETAYANSRLPHGPDEDRLRRLLMQCLEAHYGSLSQAIAVQPEMHSLLTDLQWLVDRYRGT
ncbi:MAG: nucleotidyltransferase domain-containing protein [Armatimonadia bacterium]